MVLLPINMLAPSHSTQLWLCGRTRLMTMSIAIKKGYDTHEKRKR